MKAKMICLLLALCMVISVLAACGASSDNQNPSQSSETTKGSETSSEPGTETGDNTSKIVPDDLVTQDFNGYLFSVLYSNRGLLVLSELDDISGDIIEDQIFDGAEAVRERFNIEYERIYGGNDNEMASKVNNSVLASGTQNEFSMTIGHDFLTVSNAMKGCYADLTEVPAFNFSKPWWPENNLNSISVGGYLYVASSYVSYSPMQSSSVLLFNKDMCKNLGLEDPYQTVFDGKWTMEALMTFAEAGYSDKDSDGVINIDSGDTFGFVLGREAGYNFQRSCDVVPISKDEDDMPYFSLDAEKAYEFLDKFEMLCQDYGKFYTDDNTSQNTTFSQNAALTVFSSLKTVYTTIRGYKDVTYGFLPVPKLNEQQEEYISGSTDMLWGIPTTSTEFMKEISTIIEALSCQTYNYVLPVFYEETMQKKLSEAPEDTQVLDIVRDTTALSFAYFYSNAMGGTGITMADLPRNTTSGELSSYIQTNQTALEQSLAKLVETYEELQKAQ